MEMKDKIEKTKSTVCELDMLVLLMKIRIILFIIRFKHLV